MLLLGSPLFAFLSEKTQSIIDNKEYRIDSKMILKDVLRAFIQTFRNILWQLVYLIALFILTIIPVFGWLSPLFYLFIDGYYTGFSMLDYTNERNHLNRSASADLINNHRGLAIGNGLVFYIVHAIPVVGAIFAPGYAIVAATLSIHHAKENDVILT